MDITTFLNKVNAYILNPALAVLFAVAFIYFVVAVIKLINAPGDKKAEARNAVIWSLVGMFIMVSVYGIIKFVLQTIDVPTGANSSTSYISGQLGQ